jgi:hypothetical protein
MLHALLLLLLLLLPRLISALSMPAVSSKCRAKHTAGHCSHHYIAEQ